MVCIITDDASSLLSELKPFEVKPYSRSYNEHIHFDYDPVPDVDIVNDLVRISSATEFNEKLALSHGIARYVG
jgi:uncharacterized Rmd1/YagE family protein